MCHGMVSMIYLAMMQPKDGVERGLVGRHYTAHYTVNDVVWLLHRNIPVVHERDGRVLWMRVGGEATGE